MYIDQDFIPIDLEFHVRVSSSQSERVFCIMIVVSSWRVIYVQIWKASRKGNLCRDASLHRVPQSSTVLGRPASKWSHHLILMFCFRVWSHCHGVKILKMLLTFSISQSGWMLGNLREFSQNICIFFELMHAKDFTSSFLCYYRIQNISPQVWYLVVMLHIKCRLTALVFIFLMAIHIGGGEREIILRNIGI